MEHRVLEIFEETNGLLTGHFRLRSGLHSTKFLQTAVVLQYPEIASMLCNQVASRLQKDLNLDADGIDIVMGPAIGGVILAHEVARSLNCRAMFGEKSDSGIILRPGFEIRPNDQVVIIDDVLTTGSTASACARELKIAGALSVSVLTICLTVIKGIQNLIFYLC